MSAASSNFLKACVDTVSAASALSGWTVVGYIPGPDYALATGKLIALDLREIGDDVLSDGSGHGVSVAGLVLCKMDDATASPVAARDDVVAAVEAIHEALRTGKGTRADKFSALLDSPGVVYGVNCVTAVIGIERKLV